MNNFSTSLDALHDLVLPATVPWWPPAPGWYGVLMLMALAVAWLARRCWKRRQANAYRRAALNELASLDDAAAIAELLRRTALAGAPRTVVAGMTGTAWTDWLAAQSAEVMPPAVRQLLTVGVYGRPAADREVSVLRDYTARWIARHHLVSPDARVRSSGA